jgi:hypothetical protein
MDEVDIMLLVLKLWALMGVRDGLLWPKMLKMPKSLHLIYFYTLTHKQLTSRPNSEIK